MEMSCQNFHHAEVVGTALGEFNPCHVGLAGFGSVVLSQKVTAAFAPTVVPDNGQYWGFHFIHWSNCQYLS